MAFSSVYFSTYCTFILENLSYFLTLPSKCLSSICDDVHTAVSAERVIHKKIAKRELWRTTWNASCEEDGHRGQTNLYYSLLRNLETIFSVRDCIWKMHLLWGFHFINKDTKSCDFVKTNEKMKLLRDKDANKNLASKHPRLILLWLISRQHCSLVQ